VARRPLTLARGTSAGRRNPGTTKKPKGALADTDAKKGTPLDAGADPKQPGKRPVSPPVNNQIHKWTGVAGILQTALKEADLGHGVQWPCCQRFLTGTCGADCRTCARAGAPCRGDKAARDVAAKTLRSLIQAKKLTAECAEQISKGEAERA
jgi:hypothetical protein